MNEIDSIGTHSLAPYFELINEQGTIKKFPELISDRPLILLIVNTGCGVCSTDVEDFAKESINYSQHYNFVLITNEISDQYNLNLEHKFNEILVIDEKFLTDYQIQRYPTFILINTFGQIVATPAFTHQFKDYYDPLHIQSIEA
ncbi:redoxin domain-containing protein [Exiguobacterium sp. s142]|uniref:redoxin domain-containing protein n=1 Tax=Exiguobacterium sp. s142 TaxID=2751222 RepID=UPI001BE87146|nr:redoxin domain-containing protein [Exiguobacterium sp. s142]